MNSSDFRASAAQELVEIRNEVLSLATDRDVYWRVQREVIQKNARLLTTSSPFFDMLNDAYAHATASRVRRLVDHDSRTVSLRRLLEQLADYPELLAGKMSADDLKRDLAELETTCKKVKDYVDQFVAHHDRNSCAPAPTHRELNQAVYTVIAKFRTYYALINNADVDPVVGYLEDPLSIFRFPWIDAPNAPAGR
jgi:DNA mismatch repair ATPase MutS